MARAPKNHTVEIARLKQQMEERLQRLHEKQKAVSVRRDKQNMRMLRDAGLPDWEPHMLMGALLELAEQKKEARNERRWSEKGHRHFRAAEPEGPRVVSERDESGSGQNHEGQAAA